jgi:hypothetical protein
VALRHDADHQSGAHAATIGVKHVITSEGDPKTEFGHDLTEKKHCSDSRAAV